MCLCCQSDLRSALAFRKLCNKVQKRWGPRPIDGESFSSSDSDPEREKSTKDKPKDKCDDDMRKPLQETFQILIEQDSSDNNLIGDSGGEEEKIYSPTSNVVIPRKRYRRRLKSKPEDQLNICEMCGFHATSKPVFERHMRKHSGERPFGCE